MFDSILSISADIETIGEILKKIIPTLEEVGSFFCVFANWGGGVVVVAVKVCLIGA